MSRFSSVVAVTASAAYVGVMLCIGVGLGGYWLLGTPSEFATSFETVFPYLFPCIGVTLMPGGIGCAVAWRRAEAGSPARRAWNGMGAALLTSVVVTAVYHVPANLRIWSGTLTEAELASELKWWLVMHAARLGFALVGVILGARELARQS